ncbi:MAG: septum formation inhibitor Maf [Gammaproteobacteria bacterium]|nr:septum formation inhibitor Maf [Gammaproteobacteria bacterium]
MAYDSIVLASASERRSRLLAQIGVRHRILATEIDESPRGGEAPGDYVARLATGKARAAVEAERGRPGCPVLAADTTVVLDRSTFGKPADEAECVATLTKLAGRRHEVLTAIALWHDGRLDEARSTSYVTFRAIDAAECRRYWATGEPAGKAGAYAIQGLGAVFVQCLEGSFSNVMGLPLFETSTLLDAAGVQRWQIP